MKHEREGFVGENFLIRKMIKKMSGGIFRAFVISEQKTILGGYVSCMKKMKNTISWGLFLIYDHIWKTVVFSYMKNDQEDFVGSRSWGDFFV